MAVEFAAERPIRSRRWFVRLAIAAGAVGLLAWLFLDFSPHAPPTIPIPTPNGFDDLLKAAHSIRGTPPKALMYFAGIVRLSEAPEPFRIDPTSSAWDEARSFLDANRETLAMARVALDRESVVPIAYVPGYLVTGSAYRSAMNDLRSLFAWEARLAIREGRDLDAVRSCLDLIRLGHASCRGGVESDYWSGVTNASGGLVALYEVRDKLDPATCRRAIEILAALDEDREPYANYRERERAVQVAEQGQAMNSLARILNAGQIARFQARFDDNFLENLAQARLVRVALALRAYQAEKGELPRDLAFLVPAYIRRVPLDPFSGKPPVYKPAATTYRLYSVGQNRLDDGAPLDR